MVDEYKYVSGALCPQEGGWGTSGNACGGTEAKYPGTAATGGLPNDHHRQVWGSHRQVPQHSAECATVGGGK